MNRTARAPASKSALRSASWTRAALIPALALTAVIAGAVGCGRPDGTATDAESVPESYRGRVDGGAFRHVWSTEVAGMEGHLCWRTLDAANPVDDEVLANAGVPLNLRPVSTAEVLGVVERSARANLEDLLGSGARATGACATAIPAAVATMGSLLVPGAQPVAPLTLVILVAQLVGCGLSAKTAADAAWNTWSFHWIKGNVQESRLGAPQHGVPSEALNALIGAVTVAENTSKAQTSCPSIPSTVH